MLRYRACLRRRARVEQRVAGLISAVSIMRLTSASISPKWLTVGELALCDGDYTPSMSLMGGVFARCVQSPTVSRSTMPVAGTSTVIRARRQDSDHYG